MDELRAFAEVVAFDRDRRPATAAKARASARLDRLVESRSPRRRRRLYLGLAAAGLVAVAAPALAEFREHLARVDDAPAPPVVQAIVSSLDVDGVQVSAHSVLQLRTSAGPTVTLAVTQGRRGGDCWAFMVEAGGGSVACPTATMRGAEPGLIAQSAGFRADGRSGPWVGVVAGLVPAGATTIEFRGSDGESAPIGTGNGYFLGETPVWNASIDVVALDASGAVIESEASHATPPLDPVGPRTTIATQALDGVELTASWYPAAGGRTCVNLSDNGTHDESHFRCLAGAPLTIDGPSPWPTPGGGDLTTVLGTVPGGTVEVELDLGAGSPVTVPAENGGFLYVVAQDPLIPAPISVTARALDAEGNTIATVSSP